MKLVTIYPDTTAFLANKYFIFNKDSSYTTYFMSYKEYLHLKAELSDSVVLVLQPIILQNLKVDGKERKYIIPDISMIHKFPSLVTFISDRIKELMVIKTFYHNRWEVKGLESSQEEEIFIDKLNRDITNYLYLELN